LGLVCSQRLSRPTSLSRRVSRKEKKIYTLNRQAYLSAYNLFDVKGLSEAQIL